MMNEIKLDDLATSKMSDNIMDIAREQTNDEITHLKEQLKVLEGRFLRSQAEMDNMRKRTLREREEAHKFAATSLLKDILKISDNLDRAQQSLAVVAHGLAMVLGEMATLLGKNGVKPVLAAEGVMFDPHMHQAIGQAPSDSVASGAIIDVSQAGYMMHDRLLRPAMVTVSQGPGASQEEDPAIV